VSRLTFLGGAGTVTGSRFLVEHQSSRVLVDAGLYQGPRQLRRRNWAPFPVDPATIDAVVVTHAHVDHVGYLPLLVRHGFRGPVFCSGGTAALAAIVLPDSGHLQEEEASRANRYGTSRHRPALPLYTEAEARKSLEYLQPVDFHEVQLVAPGFTAELRPAGHILGSAIVRLTVGEGAAARRVVFSGDLGRPSHPVLRPPSPPGDADVIVMESTYGDRPHSEHLAPAQLAAVVSRTVERGGTIVLPAFAVDRTELVLFHLRMLRASGVVPPVPVFVDSPMALSALDVYRDAIAGGDADISASIDPAVDPFTFTGLAEVADVDASRALARVDDPCIIISASGMASGGRVVHHLARLLPDPRNCVVLVGFQAAGTRGRLLADGATSVRILGKEVPVEAEVAQLDFSAHASGSELCDWLFAASGQPSSVYLVHGEERSSQTLAAEIRRRGWKVDVPATGDTVELN
jgi:metallo-beta-lactamase family protein